MNNKNMIVLLTLTMIILISIAFNVAVLCPQLNTIGQGCFINLNTFESFFISPYLYRILFIHFSLDLPDTIFFILLYTIYSINIQSQTMAEPS